MHKCFLFCMLHLIEAAASGSILLRLKRLRVKYLQNPSTAYQHKDLTQTVKHGNKLVMFIFFSHQSSLFSSVYQCLHPNNNV